MLISEKTTGSIYFILFYFILFYFQFFPSKEVYPRVTQLEKITVKKAQAKVVKWVKNKSWVLRNSLPLGHLSVKECLHHMLVEFEQNPMVQKTTPNLELFDKNKTKQNKTKKQTHKKQKQKQKQKQK